LRIKILILTLLVVLASFTEASSFVYSYNDPCTGVLKKITVPNTGITVAYYGQTNTFSPQDFSNGAFETWTAQVYSSYGGNNPCSEIVGVPTAVNIAQSTATNFIGLTNSLSALADIASSATGGTSNVLGVAGSVQNSTGAGTGGSGGGDNKGDSKSSGGSGSGTSGGNSGSGNSGGGSSENNSSTPTSSSSNSSGSGNNNSGNNGDNSSSGDGEGGKSNLVGGSVSSVQGSTSSGGGSSSSSKGGSNSNNTKNGNRPNILASSDIVGYSFNNADVKQGAKVSGGYTAMKWDGSASYGISADYTSAIRGPNITGFYAFMHKRRIDLISLSTTVGFGEKMTVYGTFAFGQMWSLTKKKKLKLVYMVTASSGKVSGEKYLGTAAIAGGMYDWKVSKRIDVKMLCLYVYAPYVSYYNDILLKSPHVVLPIIGTNIGITKKFKFNVNVGGAWAVNVAALNYTIMFGTRILL
jgi:hypothetical protein